jgi:protein-S-isoprenylcysteine O-methyltransferase Ste14
MNIVDAARHWLALFVTVMAPGTPLFWLVIHPGITLWRRVGPVWAYAAGFGAHFALGVGIWHFRHKLLMSDYGANLATLSMGVALCLTAGVIRRLSLRRLSIRVLLGLAEIAPERCPEKLVTGGIYAFIRHPRYAEVVCTLLGYALICNHAAAYAAVFVMMVGLLIVVPLEERELENRYGAAYVAYRAEVPALIPRFRSIRQARSILR